ncbi:fumarylacetoacetase [Bordetella bronchiseptica SBL-F6116]|uniref:fumarylacetoacetase n=1 Tax=Bordetella bronchiseptica TaxID=518 RepID=UPI0004597C92|nr:fumarylacetoacetase [Bordetella bronchiseptica]KCV25808.1 fumarylacetoacetase [Bordetella bronchiseptica 00-P-2730]KDE01572.1 fumarylacetoacetase [Bordetella bronchiseptica SBL-F6116]
MSKLNETHDPALQSWVASANAADTSFPIQNLPFAAFRRKGTQDPFRPGVAIGDAIVDLAALAAQAPFDGAAAAALAACQGERLNALMALDQAHWSALRLALSRALRTGSALQARIEPLLVAQAEAEYTTPAHIGDYTDFYISVHHATAVGKQFRPDNPLLPNYKWVPIGYHGRASSIGVDQRFARPVGQTRPAAEGEAPQFGPCQRLDYELELGIFVGRGNAQGERIALGEAESHVFGLCILNDWSARDIQAWEYQPLGPFLAKNFASTISPWIVTLEALEPFRAAWTRDAADPQPLPYLESAENRAHGAFDVQMEVLISTEQSRAKHAQPALLSRSNFRDAYWNIAQLVAHHTVNGCNLQPGDMMGTGTLSGPQASEAGSLLELTNGGKQPLDLPWGEQRTFLQDGDQIIMRAECSKPGYPRIGFGDCVGTVLAAK